MSDSRAAGFSAEQRASAYPPGIGEHFWLRSRDRIVREALQRIGAEAPVLDLGCGPGVTVRHLRASGVECRGVDLATYQPIPADLAGVLGYGQDAFALPLASRDAYRTLLLLDVLEHIADPLAFLRRCLDAFPRVAHLVVTLPARQELWSNYDEFYGHCRRYDRASAARLCADAGAEVIDCRYFFHALYPLLALQRLLSIGRSVEFAPVRHRRVHDLVARCLHLEARVLPGWLPGSSLLVTARGRR